jgi:hypothetical protein
MLPFLGRFFLVCMYRYLSPLFTIATVQNMQGLCTVTVDLRHETAPLLFLPLCSRMQPPLPPATS